MKWHELEKMGVKRCNGVYSSRATGKSRQCARRAVQRADGTWSSWCEKCGKVIGHYETLREQGEAEMQ